MLEHGGNMLLPVDQIEGGEIKIPVAIRFARMLNAQIVLLHVLPRHALDPRVVLADEARARTYLDTLAAQIRAAGVALLPWCAAALPPGSSSMRLRRLARA